MLFDVNLRSKMWGNTDEIPELIARSAALASICKVSADELCQLSGASHWQDARYYLRDLGCDTTIISLGADGALLITAEGEFHFPALRVDVVDTTGAGDAFVGGLLFTLSRANCWNHTLLAEAISNANACGAMAVTAKGAMTALPFPDQLNTFLSSHSLAQAMTVK